eukprot:INCI14330.1.p2 GENE.INCI14330.1~~INCI14330.1.p2  ORF type:complete len:248 (-),score=47.56 INCI14330.1:2405-3061(-)
MADEQEPPVFQPQVVLPGEDLSGRIGAVATEVKLGRGIDHRVSRTDTAAAAAKKPSKAAANVAPSITATKAGVFRFRPKNRFWVENNQKRYVPVTDDVVIGVVASRHAENYKVDVGTSSLVQLDALAFDGASKRNKPNLQVGDVVYARVILANCDVEPEISCAVSERSGKKNGLGHWPVDVRTAAWWQSVPVLPRPMPTPQKHQRTQRARCSWRALGI